MRRRIAVGIGIGILAIALAACRVAQQGTRLPIATAAHQPGACPGSDAATIQIDRVADVATGAAQFRDAETANLVEVEWPVGFSAWLIGDAAIGDAAIVFAPDSYEALRSDGPAVTIGGTRGGPGEPFHVCSIGLRTYS